MKHSPTEIFKDYNLTKALLQIACGLLKLVFFVGFVFVFVFCLVAEN